MEKQVCGNCVHYCQHYALGKKEILRVYCGHCTLQRVRNKRPDSPACKQHVPSLPDEDAFIRKEYLSKALLKYVKELELLPEIEDALEQIQNV